MTNTNFNTKFDQAKPAIKALGCGLAVFSRAGSQIASVFKARPHNTPYRLYGCNQQLPTTRKGDK